MAKKSKTVKKLVAVAAPTPVITTAKPLTTDNGVPFHWIVVGHELVSDAPRDKSFQLPVDGKIYTHVREALGGAWIYRYDQ